MPTGCGIPETIGSGIGREFTDVPAEVQEIIDKWHRLPPAIVHAIMALIRMSS